jgi:hypothetical protein
MNIFENDGKVNFVDKNNVLVGYDMCGQCCEFFGWYISDSISKCKLDVVESILEKVPENIESYIFDRYFRLKWDFDPDSDSDTWGYCVVFKLNDEEGLLHSLYLYLFNVQNGYYDHGFSMSVYEQITEEGYI